MRVMVGLSVAGLLLAGGVAFWLNPGAEPPARLRTAKVERGPIVSAVSTSGTVNAILTVQVGSQLSGQLKELLVDFNTPVTIGQPLARLDIDHLIARRQRFEAERDGASAALAERMAVVTRVRADLDAARAQHANMRAQTQRAEATLREAERELVRRRDLTQRGVGSTADLDRAQTGFETARAGLTAARAQEDGAGASLASMQAQIVVAEAQVDGAAATVAQREAALREVLVDLERSEIKAPIDGVVVLRNVDIGQTVAASLQAPTLFSIARDLRQVEIHASVDEGDIGRIQPGHPVSFTVNAYPNDNFRGEVRQVRLAPQVIQNIVTYVVVIAADNADLRLLPGMTATARIETDRRDNAVKVPNAALRFRPQAGLVVAAAGEAAPGAAPQGGGANRAGPAGPTPEQILANLRASLTLAPEQDASLVAALDDSRREAREIAQAQINPDQRRQRNQALRQRTNERIQSILTSTQRQRLAELRAEQSGSRAAVVHVPDGEGRVRAVNVRIGLGDGGFTEVIGGLSPGQDVVVGADRVGGASPQAGPPGPRLGL